MAPRAVWNKSRLWEHPLRLVAAPGPTGNEAAMLEEIAMAGVAAYAQVDSYSGEGHAALERHEITGRAYNNSFGPIYAAPILAAWRQEIK